MIPQTVHDYVLLLSAFKEDKKHSATLADKVTSFGDEAIDPVVRLLISERHYRTLELCRLILLRLNLEKVTKRLKNEIPSGEMETDLRVGRVLAALKDPAAFDVLSKVLQSGLPWAQFQVMAAFGESQDPRAVPALIDLMTTKKDSNLNWQATYALGKIGRAAQPYLVACLKNEDANIRQRVIMAFRHMQDRSVAKDVAEALRDSDPDVLATTIQTLGECGDVQYLNRILAFQNHGSERVRWAVAYALGKLVDPSGFSVLCAMIDDTHSAVSRAAAHSLSAYPSSDAVQVLMKTVEYHADWRTREEAAESLGIIGKGEAVNLLRALLQSDHFKKLSRKERKASARKIELAIERIEMREKKK